jgi:glycosyltransferase involved in cell wall biosynthesis
MSWPADDDFAAMSSDRDITVWLDRLARRANGRTWIDVPVGGGPCLLIRRDCLAEIGPPRPALFAQGEGAQEDFCARAAAAGWRNIALPGLFVGQRCLELSDDGPTTDNHATEAPSAAARDQLRNRNNSLIRRLHPEFAARLDAAGTADPLALARRRLDLARWRGQGPAAAILVTHDDGGGVERRIAAAVAAHKAEGRRATVLRPMKLPDGAARVAIDGASFPNLRFELPREAAALSRLLRGAGPVKAELHHFLNHDPSLWRIVAALDVPYDVHTHDFAWFCPRIALVGRGDRYCGEPGPEDCAICVAETGSYLHEEISVAALLTRSGRVLSGARRVVAPSQDAATRMEGHFLGLSMTVVPHEDDDAVEEPPPIPLVEGTVRICIGGAIGVHKGFQVLLACARDAQKRALDLSFVVAGTTIDDRSLMDTGRVFVTGPYEPDEAVALIRAQNAALALLPSIWPETWCLGLSELWRAGLRVAAFDAGAPAERIRRSGRGFLLPLGLAPPKINDALLNAARGRSFLPIRRSSAYKPPH